MALAKTKITELTVQERACQALVVEHTEAQLEEMAQRNADVKEIKDAATHELVKQGQRDLRVVRMSIETSGKVAREDARAFSAAVIEEEKRLIGIIKPEEDRLKELSQAETKRKKDVAEEKRNREINRIHGITERIDRIKGLPMLPAGSVSDVIETALAVAQGIHIDDSYEEYAEPAQMALTATISALSKALEQQEAFEAQRAQIAEQQATMAAQQKKMDEQAAEQQAIADAERKKREEAEERERKAERERLAQVQAENERLEREASEKKAAEQAEIDSAAAKIAEEEEVARQEALRPEKDRLIDWLKKLRFIDGVELHDAELADIQKRVLGELSVLSEDAVEEVSNIGATNSSGAF